MKTQPTQNPMKTVVWLAERLAISKARAYELCRTGKVPCLRIGRQLRIDENSFEVWAKQQQQQLQPDAHISADTDK